MMGPNAANPSIIKIPKTVWEVEADVFVIEQANNAVMAEMPYRKGR
jgi:hypothetical protein